MRSFNTKARTKGWQYTFIWFVKENYYGAGLSGARNMHVNSSCQYLEGMISLLVRTVLPALD
jgi:hypothetical protein